MDLKTRITRYITKKAPVTYDTMLEKATRQGYSKLELLQALEQVHKDKRITQTTKGETIVYTLATHRTPELPTHHAWLREHYPPMTPENDGSGIDIDLSWMFLKSKEERDEFRAMMSGKPKYSKPKYAQKRSRHTA